MYGPSQTTPVDYRTQSCRAFNDTAMSCVSASGVGANLYWLVSACVCGGGVGRGVGVVCVCVRVWGGVGGGWRLCVCVCVWGGGGLEHRDLTGKLMACSCHCVGGSVVRLWLCVSRLVAFVVGAVHGVSSLSSPSSFCVRFPCSCPWATKPVCPPTFPQIPASRGMAPPS